MIAAGSILGELSVKRPRLPISGSANMLGRDVERQEEASERGRGEERLGREDPRHGSDPHTWDQSNRAFYHQDLWSDALCRMQTSLALHL